MKSVDLSEVDSFLARHAFIESQTLFHSGDIFGDWRVTAFLGRGGNGEVFRVVNQKSGAEAALKVFSRKPRYGGSGVDVAKKRFENETRFLESVRYPFFPRFFAKGELDGRPWYAMELLEDRGLPHDDAGVADFILRLSKCVQLLHSMGYVHRDIKPGNIMYRRDGTAVLIDMGLLKRLDPDHGADWYNDENLSVVDDKSVGVGTPRYAAPEQFIGGKISPSSDVHALGMMINECFDGELKGCWEKIVARATSSIPERRYRDIADLIRAVRYRHLLRNVTGISCTLLFISAFTWCFLLWQNNRNNVGQEQMIWHRLCENTSTNVVVEKNIVVDEFAETRTGTRYPVKWRWQPETNEVPIALFRLKGRTCRFKDPLRLPSDRETWIVGPGVFDASLECGEGGAKVRLENCLFNNRSKHHPSELKIRYELAGGACLNFTEHDGDVGESDFVVPFDGAHNAVRFKGPETIKEYNILRQEENRQELEREF